MDKVNTSGNWLKNTYWGFVQGENFIGNFLLLIIRVYWGWQLIMTGIGKWMHIHAVGDYFATLDLPFPLLTAYFIATLELIGGISLLLGLFSRFFAFLLTILLIMAYVTTEHDALVHFFTNPKLFISKEPFLFLYASLVVMCFGPGFISLDYWLERRVFGSSL